MFTVHSCYVCAPTYIIAIYVHCHTISLCTYTTGHNCSICTPLHIIYITWALPCKIALYAHSHSICTHVCIINFICALLHSHTICTPLHIYNRLCIHTDLHSRTICTSPRIITLYVHHHT